MNTIWFDKKLHKGRLFGTLRRTVAGALTGAMLLPTVPTFAAGGQLGMQLHPIQDETYRPDIEIESNFVRDDFGFLTGYMELGLRVKTGTETFRYLAVTLEYDTQLYTPVDWSAEAEEIVIKNDLAGTTSYPYDYYTEQLPAQKDERINDIAARTGIPDTPADDVEIDAATKAQLSAEVKDGDRALLSFWAGAADNITDNEDNNADGVVYPNMTTIAVVRFKVNEDEMENFSIKKNKAGDGYDVYYNKNLVTNVVELQAEMNTFAGTTPAKWGESVSFATDENIFITEPDTELALEYRAGSVRLDPATGNADKVNGNLYNRRYYYLPGYDATKNVSTTLNLEDKTYTISKPNYLNVMEPAVKLPSAVGDADRFSYLTNLIVNKTGSADPADDHEYVTFPVVSKRSFMADADILDTLTTIVYVDWDNTLLGTQIVPKQTDVRTLVSDHVAENFIYHDKDDTTYSALDLNNPLALVLPTDTDDSKAVAAIQSLERKDSYRGKYPYDGPQPDGTTTNTVTDGEDYPLTNKLDYVFCKRPMISQAELNKPNPKDAALYPLGVNDPAYIAALTQWESDCKANNWDNIWVQKTEETTPGDPTTAAPVYDVERPFAYGWAKCTPDNFEDVWTTLASNGELVDYAVDASGISSVTYEGTEKFLFADLEKGFAKDEGTVFLKAIYEPGTDLMISTARYRMIKEPYYNKRNPAAAARGGAYSVDFTFERANNTEGGDDFVRGVPRIRMPAVRQEVTTDTLWETYTKDGEVKVDHDLPNPTLQDAKDATKSAYIRVAVDNGETIDVSMTLSGRQNKVNYYLRDEYNSNFVAGSARTLSNIDIMEDTSGTNPTFSTAWVADNFNYYVADQSYENDLWYDAPYADREGSYGFVLFGTLNVVMEKATLHNHDTSESTYSQFVTAVVLNDANIRVKNGDPVDSRNFLSEKISQVILDAAWQAENAHNSGNNDWWNLEKDCAELTYHQLQNYIITYTAGTPHGSGVLLPDATEGNPIAALTWCHLHKACADANSGKPKDWPGLLNAAKNSPDDIDKMTLTEIEAIAHLRSNGNGDAFSSVTAFKNAIVKAVKDDGCTTWDEIQDNIVRGPGQTDAVQHSKDTYWWFDGKTVSLNSFADLKATGLVALGKDVNAKAPGETAPVARNSKINRMESIYNLNKTSVGDSGDITAAWRKATENLCDTIDGKEGQVFTTFQDFRDRFTAALDAYITDTTGNQTNDPDWYQVQYAILNSNATSGKEGTGSASPDYAGYWWHNGATKVQDLATLLKAARDYVGGNTASWDNFTDPADLYDAANKGSDATPGLGFRSGFNGAKYTAADFDDFKAKVLAFVQDPIVAGNDPSATSDDWDALQFYIIEGSYPATATQRKLRAAYFWWKNGGETATVDFSSWQSKSKPEERADALAKAAADAAFRNTYNGNTIAWHADSDEAALVAALKSGRLVKTVGTDASKYPDNFTFYEEADLDDLKTKAKELLEAKSGATTATFPAPTFTWEELQYYILTGNTTEDPDVTATYWWKSEDEKPQEKKKPEEDFQEVVKLIAAVAEAIKAGDDPSAAETALRAYLTEDVAQNMGLSDSMGMGLVQQAELDAIVWTGDPLNDGALVFGFSDDLDDGGLCWGPDGDQDFTFTWYQLQDIILNGGMYLDSADVAESMITGGDFGFEVTVPDWVATDGTVTVPATYSLFAMRRQVAPIKPSVETTLSPDGRTETTKTTTQVWNVETQSYDTRIVTVSRTKVETGETTLVIVTTTTVTTTIDPVTGEVRTTSETTTETVEETEKSDPVYTNTPDTDIVDLPGDTSDDTGADIIHPDIPEETPGDETDAPNAGEDITRPNDPEEKLDNGPDNAGGTSEGEDTDLPDAAPPLSDTPYVIEPDTDIVTLSAPGIDGLPNRLRTLVGIRSAIRPRIKSNLATVQRLRRPTGEEGDPMTTKLYHMDDILALTVLPNRLLAFSSLWDSGGPPQWGPIILQHDAQGRAFL